MPPTGHHAPPPGAVVKVKPCGSCATLTPLAVVARLTRRLRWECRRIAAIEKHLGLDKKIAA
jgi:hypothetical protein